MTDPSGYAETLALPAGFDAPRLLRYDDVTAHAITCDDLGADVRGINAILDLIRETRGGTWPTGPRRRDYVDLVRHEYEFPDVRDRTGRAERHRGPPTGRCSAALADLRVRRPR
jgi:hypothetical protein